MEKINISIGDLHAKIAEFYDPKIWRFITVNAVEIEDGFEIQWIFAMVGKVAPERILFTTTASDQSVPSITSIIPAAKYSESEMLDMLGVLFDGAEKGIFLESDVARAPLRKKK